MVGLERILKIEENRGMCDFPHIRNIFHKFSTGFCG